MLDRQSPPPPCNRFVAALQLPPKLAPVEIWRAKRLQGSEPSFVNPKGESGGGVALRAPRIVQVG